MTARTRRPGSGDDVDEARRDAWKDREQIIANLQAALTLANELEMGTLACLIERALDEAQAAQFAALLPKKPAAGAVSPCDGCLAQLLSYPARRLSRFA
jgi:hypothetical protein